jgi:hypothetical protein
LNDYITFLDIYQRNINITRTRLQHGKQVCANRNIEGEYINSSLEKLRLAIKDVIATKHEVSDSIYHSPNFINECLKTYCPTGVNCFKTSLTKAEIDKIPEKGNRTVRANVPSAGNNIGIDDILGNVWISLQKNQGEDSVLAYNDFNDFKRDLVICVFGVFNISPYADNPPPVPYVDINMLKQVFYADRSNYYYKYYPLLLLAHELKDILEKLPLSGFLGRIDDWIKNFESENKFLTMESLTTVISDRKKELDALIHDIDVHNASSTVGTLEFLDRLTKFGAVDTMCSKSDDVKKVNTSLYLDKPNDYDNIATIDYPQKAEDTISIN